jgi:CRISPR-associated protein Csd2
MNYPDPTGSNGVHHDYQFYQLHRPRCRHDFVLLFDVADGNPNGDPDAGNLPRMDPETVQGLVTDVCLKRKVRDYLTMRAQELPEDDRAGLDIYVKRLGVLNQEHQRAYDAIGRSPQNANRDTIRDARRWMCERYYDIRMFGAVMTTRINAGQVRGPVQLTFARSIDPIAPLDLTITRVAVTNLEPSGEGRGRGGQTQPIAAAAVAEEELDDSKITEMGRKAIVLYGLYRAYGFFSAYFAQDTGVTASDLGLFWEALQNMWDQDRSAGRGSMACRGLYIFSHQSPRGNVPAHLLFDRIKIARNPGVEVLRSFSDYNVSVDESNLPVGVTLGRLVG